MEPKADMPVRKDEAKKKLFTSPVSKEKSPAELHHANRLQSELNDHKWYAIYTRSRFEKKLYQRLQKAGIDSFLPLVKEKRIWSDRLKTVEVPLLPGYVFVYTHRKDFPKVYQCPGFVRFVCFDGKPCEIREKEIRLLEKIVQHGYQTTPSSHKVCLGDQVKIVRGPLHGWEGRVEKKKGSSRIVFQFDCIQQALSVEVGLENVEKVLQPLSSE